MSYDFDFNQDQELRDSKLHVPTWAVELDIYDETYYSCGIRRFDEMSPETLEWMLENKFANSEDRQNNSPSIAEFLEFMHLYPDVTALGYVVHKNRGDYRLTVEGVEYDGAISKRMALDIVDNFRNADEFDLDDDGFRVWYD